MAWYPRPPLRPTILVRQIAHVLAASRLGATLCGMDLELPSRAVGQYQHPGVDRRLCSHRRIGIGSARSRLGTCDEETDTNREAREGTHGFQGKTATSDWWCW